MRKTVIYLSFLLLNLNLVGQSWTGDQLNQGYALFGSKLTFIFEESLYNVQPSKVVVTGEFRGWSQDMNDEQWNLQKTGNAWLLTIDNTDFAIVKPNTKFKFRVDDGDWLDPHAGAKNVSGSDLVFEPDYVSAGLKAELLANGSIWAEISGFKRPLTPNAYRIVDAQGNEYPVKTVLPNGATTTLISTDPPLDKKRVYFLEIPNHNLSSHASFDGWFRKTISSKELGANIDNGKTVVRLFAPRAEMVKLYLYEGPESDAINTIEMVEDQDGVWEAYFNEDLHGTYYDFTIHGAEDPGNHFFESNPVHIRDPYARVVVDTWGRGRIWRRTEAATPLVNGIPAMEDVIAYEVHVQDFTDNLPVSDEIRSRFPAMHKSGLRNKKGEKIGFDHILDLGINVVHLMPVQEYVHFPTEDWKASFQNDPYMIDQGVSEENYQWGYRTTFAMAVESRYRSLDKEPGAERDEFRDLVQAFHDNDIAVIIDIVPNHTGENMDANEWYFNFNAIDKQYYYRTKDFEHIGAYGNEVKMENRPMTQRWIIDQCQYYIDEFGIDGFRIDLAGQIDEQTLKALKATIGEDKIVYGEAWIGSNDPDYENNPDWDWYKEDAPITFFQDDSRGAYKGPVFELKDYKNDRGWAGGKFSEREAVMKGLINKNPDDKTPNSGISYLDIHDNFALADQFGGPEFDGRTSVDQSEYKIAVALLYTTLGPLVTHGGSEIMRSKAHAPLKEVVKTTNAGYNVYMHGYRDTYNHRTANQFVWSQKGQKATKSNTNDYANMYAFWKGMNEFRLSEYGQVFRVADAVEDDYYQWITPEDESLLGYVVNEQVFVLINAGEDSYEFDQVVLPEGNWKLIANTNEVNMRNIKDKRSLKNLKGSEELSITMESTSLRIWVKQ